MTLTQSLQLAWNTLNRDRRSGELRLLLLSLIVAVAAMSSVGFFIDRLRAGLENNAAQLLGADLVMSASQRIDDTVRQEAAKRGLTMAETVVFTSMALAHSEDDAIASEILNQDSEDAKSQLSSVKAVSTYYPLRGSLRIGTSIDAPDQAATSEPETGTVWVDAALLPALDRHLGDSIQLGEKHFILAHIITQEPDRGMAFANIAPRIMMNIDDLAATELIQNGSRETWRLMFAGNAEAIRDFRQWLTPRLGRGQRLESLDSGQPQVRATLDRAGQFLALVALLTAMLAAVAVMLAARRFTQRHLDGCAVMRCLGISQGDLLRLHLFEFVFIGLIGASIGVLLGYAAHFVFIELLGPLAGMQNEANRLPQPTLWPALQGFVLGFLLLIGFALPPVMQLHHVPPIRVLRRDVGLPRSSTALGYIVGIGLFAALLIWTAGNVRIGLYTAGGFALAFAIFAGVTWLLLRLTGRLRNSAGLGPRLNPTWRFALASIERRPAATIVQTVALAIGLMALLLLSVTRTDLVSAWHQSIPADAPNRFIINIQPEQRAAFQAQLQGAGIAHYDFSPMVRGRLIAINGKPIDENTYADDGGKGGNASGNGAKASPASGENNAQRMVNREFNLSYMDAPPSTNRIVAGRWFAPDAKDELSVEEGLAKTLHIQLGDTLRFDIAGPQVEAKVTSLRKLDWDSMHVNFFVIFPPAVLSGMAQTSIAAVHLDAAHKDLGNRLVAAFPNITVVDTGAILRQVQSILDQVVSAIEFLFVFTLIAGLLVLYAALLSSRDERTREAALLRALGASRRQLSLTQLAEFICVGTIAGVLAAAGAVAIGYVLATQAFDFPYHFSVMPWLLGIAGGAAIAVIGGWLGLRPVLNHPPLATLREV